MYKLKPNVPDFEVVDGPFAGRKYTAGETYKEVPENENHKFVEIGDAVKDKNPKSKTLSPEGATHP